MILAQNETICKQAGIKTKIQGAKIVIRSASQNLEIRCAARLLPLLCSCHRLVMVAVGIEPTFGGL
jgi:hypothetical protein